MLREQHSDDANRTARIEVRATHEARMPKEDHILTLKNGGKAFARIALADSIDLRYVLQHHRRHFDVLLSLMRSEGASTPQSHRASLNESIRFLRRRAYLEEDGSLRARIRDVLESGYQVTPDGPVITQPFLLATDADKAAADRAATQLDNWFANGMRGLFDVDDDHGPCP
jgi:hypothetical protein